MAAATATAPAPSGVSLVLSGKWLYALLGTLIAFSVLGTFVFDFIPNFLGLGAFSASTVSLFAYAAHDLTDDNSAPGWVTFTVITVGGGLMAAAGVFAHNTPFAEASALAAALVFFSFLYHALATDAGKSVSPNLEAYLTAGTGAVITILQWVSANPAATTATLIVTIVTTLSTVFHVTEEDGAISIAPVAATAPV